MNLQAINETLKEVVEAQVDKILMLSIERDLADLERDEERARCKMLAYNMLDMLGETDRLRADLAQARRRVLLLEWANAALYQRSSV